MPEALLDPITWLTAGVVYLVATWFRLRVGERRARANHAQFLAEQEADVDADLRRTLESTSDPRTRGLILEMMRCCTPSRAMPLSGGRRSEPLQIPKPVPVAPGVYECGGGYLLDDAAAVRELNELQRRIAIDRQRTALPAPLLLPKPQPTPNTASVSRWLREMEREATAAAEPAAVLK